MVGAKEKDNIESVWLEIICKNNKKKKNYRPSGTEPQNMCWKNPYFRKLGRQLKVITW